jgi:hypothetical protein
VVDGSNFAGLERRNGVLRQRFRFALPAKLAMFRSHQHRIHTFCLKMVRYNLSGSGRATSTRLGFDANALNPLRALRDPSVLGIRSLWVVKWAPLPRIT